MDPLRLRGRPSDLARPAHATRVLGDNSVFPDLVFFAGSHGSRRGSALDSGFHCKKSESDPVVAGGNTAFIGGVGIEAKAAF